jgi:hypothetical protein
MTTQHTPGPWKYLRTSGFDYGSTAYWIPGICGNVKDEANARLIAAAPDLLEALKVARHMIVEDGTPIGWSVSRLDEVIAKATGAMK